MVMAGIKLNCKKIKLDEDMPSSPVPESELAAVPTRPLIPVKAERQSPRKAIAKVGTAVDLAMDSSSEEEYWALESGQESTGLVTYLKRPRQIHSKRAPGFT